MPTAIRIVSGAVALSRSSMKAWQIRSFGLNALEQVERAIPEPGPYELLIRVRAASLNYRDRLVIEGTFMPDLALPFVPASDAAGEVVAVGENVTRFRIGDRVIGAYIPGWIDGDGAAANGDYVSRGGPLPGVLAEYVVFDEQGTVATPLYLTDEEASTLPIAAVTAWTALFDHGRLLEPGQTPSARVRNLFRQRTPSHLGRRRAHRAAAVRQAGLDDRL
jgi:NADPH:quinone reductase-like Zn-dependent oxidoreductase